MLSGRFSVSDLDMSDTGGVEEQVHFAGAVVTNEHNI